MYFSHICHFRPTTQPNPLKTIFDPFPIQPNPTRGSTQPMDNSDPHSSAAECSRLYTLRSGWAKCGWTKSGWAKSGWAKSGRSPSHAAAGPRSGRSKSGRSPRPEVTGPKVNDPGRTTRSQGNTSLHMYHGAKSLVARNTNRKCDGGTVSVYVINVSFFAH